MQRLLAAEFARRSTAQRRRPSRGQTLLIFVLTFTALLGFMGLAVDSARIYDMYARMQRAAEAGAIAGVIYMPNNYTNNVAISPPGDNAVCRAQKEVYKNLFGGTPCTGSATMGTNYCPAVQSTVEIAVCPVPNQPYQLQVSITETIPVLFLSILNVGPLTLTVSATAAYLPPVQIASDPTGTGSTGSWGTFGECNGASAACTGTSSVRNWSGNINGPGELKEQGDPLVSCEEGPGGPVNSDSDNTVGPWYTTYTGLTTNHPQNTALALNTKPTNCGNPTTQGAFTGPIYVGSGSQTRAGYAFLAHVPDTSKGGVEQSVWIWNAPFSPLTPKNCNGRTGGQGGNTSYDIFYFYNCSGSGKTTAQPYPYYPGTTCTGQNPYTCLDPDLYFSVTYSIYQISGPTDTGGTLVSSYTAWPYAGQGSCANGSWQSVPSKSAPYNSLLPNNPTCIASPCVANWCPLGLNQIGDATMPTCGAGQGCSLQPGGWYRVMVVASDYGDPNDPHFGWGGHSYSLKLCQTGVTTQATAQTCTSSGTISGWNLSDTLFIFPGGGKGTTQITEYPLGVIDSSFAGRTIDVQLYDPGDLSGSNGAPRGATYYAVAPPTGAADPCTATTTDLSAANYTNNNFVFSPLERTAALGALPALEPALNGDLIYNGLWADERITVPANYLYSGQTWTLCASAPQTNDADVLGIGVFALGQSPVHLVQ